MDTRGLRHLKAYIGEDGANKAKAKRAADVVPVLAARRLQSASHTASTGATSPLSPAAMAYLEGRLRTGATNRLSRTQLSLVNALTTHHGSSNAESAVTAATAPVSVTRGKVATLTNMVDVVALAALELRARVADASSPSSPLDASSLFVLTEDPATAAEVAQQLEDRYGVTVLRLVDAAAPRHPVFPSGNAQRSRTTRKSQAAAVEGAATGAPADAPAAVVVVASPAGFLAVDRRSAVWKFIGAFVVLLCQPDTQSGSLLSVLGGTTGTESSITPQALNTQRWACLGHVAKIAVAAQAQAWLSHPAVDFLTTWSVAKGGGAAPAGGTGATASKATATATAKALASSRRPVTVHYTVAEGTQRFQFLFSLLKGLVPHRGLVVHVATRECATFLYDTLYSFLDELPSYVQILSDYEGASEYTNMHTSGDRKRLCAAFDKVVLPNGGKTEQEKTAAVLISCYGLVPRSGSVFLQYDIIPDVVNYAQFLADVLTPGAVVTGKEQQTSASPATKNSEASALEVHRERTTRQRKRSVSPTPVPAATRRASADQMAQNKGEGEETARQGGSSCANYTHILLLFRPNEVHGALARLRHDGNARYALSFHELPSRAGGRFLFIGEKLKSLNKRLFAIQNAAYNAYRATMRVYSTVGPRDVYDETRVALEAVAAEFGYTELPLLDLRLKDTAFRTKEDYYKAARQKQAAERRAYRKFANDNIVGEEPEEHVADE